MKYDELKNLVSKSPVRSAWSRGVRQYALELLENIDDFDLTSKPNRRQLERALLNGAFTPQQYSESGCALIYDKDIANRLCNPTELRKTDNGRKSPNRFESWLDVQSRAIFQAIQLILSIVEEHQ